MARFYLVSGLLLSLIFGVAAGPQSESKSQAAPAATTGQGAQSAPQDSQQKPAPVYESATVLKTITRLVVVDVVATDKKGEAVSGLERPDFTVLEDGKPQEIRAFAFQEPTITPAGGAAPGSAAPDAPKLPDNIYTNIPKYNSSNALNVLLLDGLNTTLTHQAYVRYQMLRYLEKMPEGQPVAVYALGTKLTLLQDFTSDPALLRSLVKNLNHKVSPLLDNAAGGPAQELLPPGLADSDMMPTQMLESMQQFEQERVGFQTDLRVNYTLNALNSIARALAAYPGRKNLIWISEGFPLSIDPNMELSGDVFAGTRNYGPQVAQTAEALIDAQIAIYPIDARGLEASAVFDASSSGRDKFGRAMTGPRLGASLRAESAGLQATHATMNDMAERTGGKAFYNRNDIDGAIRHSIQDGSTYYTLAYYPQNKDWNGKFRKIEIKINRPGVQLRHRLGYYAVNPQSFAEKNQKQQAAAFGQALSLDVPVSTGLLFRVGVLPPSDQTQNKVLVNFGIDPHAISFERQADGLQHATLDCVVQAYSGKGKLIKTESSTINAALKPETFTRIMQGTFPCRQFVDLPAGNYFLRLGVRDDRTGLIGTVNAKVTVTQTSAGAAVSNSLDNKKPN